MVRFLAIAAVLALAPAVRAQHGEPAAEPAHAEPAHGEPAHGAEPAHQPAHGEPPHGEASGHSAQSAHGAGHEEHGIQNWWSWDYGPSAKDPAHKDWPPPFGYALINFVIFFGIMMKLAGKPLKSFVTERHDRIRKDLDEAAKLRKAAEQQLEQYTQKVKNVDAEIETLLVSIRKEAESEKARIIANAEAQAERLKADAQRQIEAEIQRARTELRRGVIEAAVGAADELLKKQIGADDQRKMAEKYVADVERSTGRPS
jgi:F-type H+-transporting ATPase subunit b